MKTVTAIVLLLALGTSVNARQGDITVSSRFGTAERLVDACKKVEGLDINNLSALGKDHFEIGLCSGFIVGVVDAETYRAEIFHSFGQKDAHPSECIPSSVTTTQLAKIIVKYGNDHPDELHAAAVDFLHGVLMSSFPCK